MKAGDLVRFTWVLNEPHVTGIVVEVTEHAHPLVPYDERFRRQKFMLLRPDGTTKEYEDWMCEGMRVISEFFSDE